MAQNLLEVKNISKIFGEGLIQRHQKVALENFSLTIPADPPTITAIAGESGSGKTTLARIILDLIQPSAGEILWQGQALTQMARAARQNFRRECQAVFQDPYQAYNPFYRVDHVFKMAISQSQQHHHKTEAQQMIDTALNVVGLRPEEILGKFPHQLSGGQRQRIMVARSFLLKPRLIIADEPVSMVDASLRASILEIMLKLKKDFGVSFLYITHDLSTAYQISDQIVILYQGVVAETGDVAAVIEAPQHPYTQLLIGSIPIPDPSQKWAGALDVTETEMRAAASHGCKFYSRCPQAMPICAASAPPLYRVGDRQSASCYLYQHASNTITN